MKGHYYLLAVVTLFQLLAQARVAAQGPPSSIIDPRQRPGWMALWIAAQTTTKEPPAGSVLRQFVEPEPITPGQLIAQAANKPPRFPWLLNSDISPGMGPRGLVIVDGPGGLLQVTANANLTQKETIPLDNGAKIFSMEVSVKGYPIWGRKLVVAQNNEEDIQYDIVSDEMQDKIYAKAEALFERPAPPVKESHDLCREYFGLIDSGQLLYQSNRQIYYDQENDTTAFVDVTTIKDISDPYSVYKCVVDASNDTMLLYYLAASTAYKYPGGNAKTGIRLVSITPTVQGKDCVLSLKSDKYQVLDTHNSTDEDQAREIKFDCNNGPNDGINNSFGPAADCYDHLMKTQKCLADKANFADLNTVGKDDQLKLYIHYGKNFDGAFWNGEAAYIGDGDPTLTYSYCSDRDVISHEIAHGIVSKYSQLIYEGEAGCINEAFADITAMMVKNCSDGRLDWRVGQNIWRVPDNDARERSRNLARVTSNQHQIKHYKEFKPGMDVHLCSGIFNHAFFRLSIAKDWDIYKAYKLMFGANKVFWRENVTMSEAACSVLTFGRQSGLSLAERETVMRAFSVVGINIADNCSSGALRQSEQVNTTATLTTGEVVNVYGLKNCAPIEGLSGWANSTKYFKLTIKPGNVLERFRVTLRSGADAAGSNANVFIKYQDIPESFSDFDLGKEIQGSDMTLTVLDPRIGDYYIILYGTGDYKDIKLTACCTFINQFNNKHAQMNG